MKIVDMHCDTISEILAAEEQGEAVSLRENSLHIDLLRMRESNYLLQNFALFVDTAKTEDPWDKVCALHRVYCREMEQNSDLIAPVFCFEDIAKNEAAGKLSAMLTVEEGAVCRGELAKLRQLYDLGVRMLTLTWNHPNELGFPAKVGAGAGGLTEKGKEFVASMEELGMIVDVSHLSDAGFQDVLECTKKPFVASHSNARSVCSHTRNLTDGMIRALAERGGCMGLNFYSCFLEEPGADGRLLVTVESVVRHARHIVSVGGMEVLGLGTDFDGIDTNEALPGAQSMGILWEAMKRGGFKESELDRIFYGNVLRVYREAL